MDLVEQVKLEAKRFFENAKGSHGWDHTERVYKMCMHIGEIEGADMEVLGLAALLHDIGREHETASKGSVCHAEKSAELAKALLERLPDEKTERIIHCIECHRFRGSKTPQSLEAKILFDADKLDSIGAVGIGRAFLFAGEVGAKLHNSGVAIEQTAAYSKEDTAYREFAVKLKHLRDRMLTAEGRRIAEERHRFMEEFFDRLDKEAEGKA